MIRRPLVCALVVALSAGLAAPDADAQRKRKRSSGKARTPAVAPACADFYTFANADWLKANTLPVGASSVSALEQLATRARQQQIDLLNAAMQSPQNEVQTLLGTFWASGLDEAAVERDGAQPIAPLLKRINAIRRGKDVAPAIAALHQVGIPVAFHFAADIDPNEPDRHIGYFTQGGLGLPDPAYYTRTDADTRAVMARYDAYVRKILALTGSKPDRLAAEAKQVIDLERRIAQASKPLPELRDPSRQYARVAVQDLAKPYRNLRLAEFLKAQGVNDDAVSLADPKLFAQIDKLVGSLKPEQWKLYLRWRVGDAMAPYLAKAFRDAHFDFRGRVLHGLQAPPAREQAVLDAIELAAGPMLAREYVARHLPAAQRQRAEQIAQQVRDQLVAALARDTRLNDAAKNEARTRLQRLGLEIGAPAREYDYRAPPMGRGSFGGNMLIASTWRQREEMRRIGRGNGGRRWHVQPHQPSLHYDAAQNRLIVTAAMLQPPVFDATQDPAAQYGALGALVGHELSRAIDPRAAQPDAGGNARAGASADAAAWEAFAARVAAQYDGRAYPGLTGVKLAGAQVRDIGVADFSGLELAWAAFTAAQPNPAQPARQAFFRAWAGLWPQQLSPEAAAQRAAASPYPPGIWRTNVPLMQQPAFGEAFACKAGTPMQLKPEQAVRVWPAATP